MNHSEADSWEVFGLRHGILRLLGGKLEGMTVMMLAAELSSSVNLTQRVVDALVYAGDLAETVPQVEGLPRGVYPKDVYRLSVDKWIEMVA